MKHKSGRPANSFDCESRKTADGQVSLMDSHDSKHFGHEENPRPDPDELTPRLGCGPLKTALNPTLRS